MSNKTLQNLKEELDLQILRLSKAKHILSELKSSPTLIEETEKDFKFRVNMLSFIKIWEEGFFDNYPIKDYESRS
jgi:ribosomal protein S6